MEVTVRNDLSITGVICIGVNISLVSGKMTVSINSSILVFAVRYCYSKCRGIKYVKLTAFKLCLNFINLSLCTFGSCLSVNIGKNNRSCAESTCPIGVNCFAVFNAINSILKIRSPINS